MLTYFLGGYNNYKLRTAQLPSGSNIIAVHTQNMITLDDYAFNAGNFTYNQCESILDININIDIPLVVNSGDEYRISIVPAITSSTIPYTEYPAVWHGSLQVFASQSVDKPSYVNQIPYEETFKSADIGTEFKYWEQ